MLTLALAASFADCMCPTSADASCPMHHRTAAPSKVCVMQSVTTGPTTSPTTTLALFGVVGLMAARPMAMVPVPTASRVFLEGSVATQRSLPPDPPPPRA
jgi:hypothetical protein